MGGHHSTQSANDTEDVVTTATFNATQNCLSYMDGTQVIAISGSGNIFEGNIQESELSVDMKCVDQMSQQGDFQNQLEASISQTLQDQEIALTEWMDPGGDSQESSIVQNVTNNITFDDVQNCLASLNGTQLFVVSGSNNVVVDNLQTQTMALAQECLMSGGQAADVVNDVTSNINQHSHYDSESPFAFITDAIEAMLKSAMAIAAVVFVVIIVLVLAFEIGTRRKKPAAAPGALAAASGAAVPAGL